MLSLKYHSNLLRYLRHRFLNDLINLPLLSILILLLHFFSLGYNLLHILFLLLKLLLDDFEERIFLWGDPFQTFTSMLSTLLASFAAKTFHNTCLQKHTTFILTEQNKLATVAMWFAIFAVVTTESLNHSCL